MNTWEHARPRNPLARWVSRHTALSVLNHYSGSVPQPGYEWRNLGSMSDMPGGSSGLLMPASQVVSPLPIPELESETPGFQANVQNEVNLAQDRKGMGELPVVKPSPDVAFSRAVQRAESAPLAYEITRKGSSMGDTDWSRLKKIAQLHREEEQPETEPNDQQSNLIIQRNAPAPQQTEAPAVMKAIQDNQQSPSAPPLPRFRAAIDEVDSRVSTSRSPVVHLAQTGSILNHPAPAANDTPLMGDLTNQHAASEDAALPGGTDIDDVVKTTDEIAPTHSFDSIQRQKAEDHPLTDPSLSYSVTQDSGLYGASLPLPGSSLSKSVTKGPDLRGASLPLPGSSLSKGGTQDSGLTIVSQPRQAVPDESNQWDEPMLKAAPDYIINRSALEPGSGPQIIENLEEAQVQPTLQPIPLQDAWPIKRLDMPNPEGGLRRHDSAPVFSSLDLPATMPEEVIAEGLIPTMTVGNHTTISGRNETGKRLPAGSHDSQTLESIQMSRASVGVDNSGSDSGLIQTEIGSLPADLWHLVGATPPGALQAGKPSADKAITVPRQPLGEQFDAGRPATDTGETGRLSPGNVPDQWMPSLRAVPAVNQPMSLNASFPDITSMLAGEAVDNDKQNRMIPTEGSQAGQSFIPPHVNDQGMAIDQQSTMKPMQPSSESKIPRTALDTSDLARRVYALLKRRLFIEAERSGRH